jgi:lipopolysaccharide/colanic/teichoic acid biosynthesis glycosyltransferase
MTIVNKKEPIILGLMDAVILVISLLLTLTLRYSSWPSADMLNQHLLPFAIIFIYSIVVFYISGLYGRSVSVARTTRASIPGAIIRAQIANGLIAVILFYFIPNFGVAPKTNLFSYLFISSILIILWRLSTYPIFSLRRKYPALVIGSGAEVDELIAEMSANPRIGLSCRKHISSDETDEALLSAMEENSSAFQYIIADVNDRRLEAILPELYKRFFRKAQIIDMHELYEDVFNRIPLSCMNYSWVMSHITPLSSTAYDLVKRTVDISFGLIICLAAGIAYPFVAIAMKIEDGGPVFIKQQRTGKNGAPMHYYKFRSMKRNETGKWLAESTKNANPITGVGRFIRKTRIDELPQGLAVLKGDMSLIGPRSDIAGLGERLAEEIPYYSVRTIIKPGLTGWAQVNQNKPPQTVEENKLRMSYDLYYIKHRSLSLDFQIVLRTFKTLLSREGM